MREKKDILVKVNCPKEEEDVKELEDRKIRIMVEILKEKYGKVTLGDYLNSMRGKREDYS